MEGKGWVWWVRWVGGVGGVGSLAVVFVHIARWLCAGVVRRSLRRLRSRKLCERSALCGCGCVRCTWDLFHNFLKRSSFHAPVA